MATFRKLSLCPLQFRLLITAGWLQAGLRLAALWMIAGLVGHLPAMAQSSVAEPALTLEQVVKLSQAGFSEELIVTKIKKNGKAFDLNTDELLELKKQGLTENIIRFLMDPTQPYTPPPPPQPKIAGPPGKKYPDDPLVSLLPADPGLYFFVEKTPLVADLKILLGMRKGKIMKGKPTAYLAGPKAKLRAKAGKPIFYLRLPEGKEVSDLILTALLEKDDRRELDGLPGAKGNGLNADEVLQFDQWEVGPKLFRLSPPALEAGEYLLFLVGSAEPDKGTYGKGFDFGVDALAAEKKK